jgi:23S rRNA (uracil1939-C5)-methyltransferase
MSSTFTLQLSTMTYGGEAMGRLPDPLTEAGGRACFVPFALPGETVRVRVIEERKNFVRAELIEIVKASPDRIAPKCKHFFSVGVRACGGCHYQHIPYPKQLEFKTEIIRDQLTRIGKIQHPPVRAIVASPNEWHYRNNVQFHLTAEGNLGFMGYGAGVMEIDECHLPEKPIDEFWRQLEFDSNLQMDRVSLRCNSDDDLMLVLESDSPETPEIEIEADVSVVHLAEDDAVVIAGDDHLILNARGRSFRVSAGSFFQVNTIMAEKMIDHVLATINHSPSTIIDLYCGAGLFSAFLAPLCKRLIAIESASSACADFAINLDAFDHVELYEDLAENVLPALDVKPDLILVDPPRAGLDKKVIDAIVKIKPQMLIYVSCDPSTLARDAARLISGGYTLQSVAPFDLFPQTYHIESVSVFVL